MLVTSFLPAIARRADLVGAVLVQDSRHMGMLRILGQLVRVSCALHGCRPGLSICEGEYDFVSGRSFVHVHQLTSCTVVSSCSAIFIVRSL